MPECDIFDLEAAIKYLAGMFNEIEAIYLFGSRRFGTGSTRSDVDIIVVPNAYIKPSTLREFVLQTNTALDIFILENARATSIANDSYISGGSNEEVLEALNAMLLYERGYGTSQELGKRKTLMLDTRVRHTLTALPNTSTEAIEVAALIKILDSAGGKGLPTKPYLGQSTQEVAEFISKVIRSLPTVGCSVTKSGNAYDGWTRSLKNEYDFQNLFWIACKPWLPDLDREQIAIVYDGNEKRSDFSLFRNQLIIELKHIKDDNTKRSTVKTLAGLKDFYEQHPNVRALIFGILVDKSVDLDDRMWESSFTYANAKPAVYTVVVRNL